MMGLFLHHLCEAFEKSGESKMCVYTVERRRRTIDTCFTLDPCMHAALHYKCEKSELDHLVREQGGTLQIQIVYASYVQCAFGRGGRGNFINCDIIEDCGRWGFSIYTWSPSFRKCVELFFVGWKFIRKPWIIIGIELLLHFLSSEPLLFSLLLYVFSWPFIIW